MKRRLKDWRLAQTPYNLSSIYGPAAASSGNVTVGMPSDLFSYRLRHSSSKRPSKRRRLARFTPNAKALGQMEHVLRIDDAGSYPSAYRANRTRTKRCRLSKMAEAMVQRAL